MRSRRSTRVGDAGILLCVSFSASTPAETQKTASTLPPLEVPCLVSRCFLSLPVFCCSFLNLSLLTAPQPATAYRAEKSGSAMSRMSAVASATFLAVVAFLRCLRLWLLEVLERGLKERI